jgi:phenylpropionate dioxygenase-like ring-hydroxylating dioxygenase large terminal subunit
MSPVDLLARQPAGRPLLRDFYVREDVFALEQQMLLDRWTCVGHASQLTEPGDYFLAQLVGEEAIIVRTADGNIRALANVCRHRGSRVCREPTGSVQMFTCPYHAWTYRLDGSLRTAREMGAEFEPEHHGLKSLACRVIGGLIFISFGETPPDIEVAAAALTRMTDRYGWADARIAARRTYQVQANWKFALENYHECYHCHPSHPEFAVAHALARPGERRLDLGPEGADIEVWGPDADGSEVVRVMGSNLARGVETGSRDGRLMAPPMAAPDEACVFAELGFLSAFLAYADHGLIYRFWPQGADHTGMEVIWLVRGDAEAGRDYALDDLVWLWDVTSIADKRIIEDNHAGALSRFYEPGPFSEMEPGTAQFVARYLGEIRARLHA